MTVFVDLDGVLANFEGAVKQIFGEHAWKAEIEKPNWGGLAQYQDIYLNLPVMDDAYVLWNYLTDNYHDVQILSAIPRRAYFPDAVNHKREWVWANFGSNVRVNFGPYAYDKQFHIRHPHDILIDDMKINCDQWKERGARSIWHTSAEFTIAELKLLHA